MAEFEIVKKFSDNDLAVLDNNLIEAPYDMTATQQKLFASLVSLIRKDDTEFVEYAIEKDTLIDMLNVNKDNIYKVLFEASKSMAEKTVYIKDPEKEKFDVYPFFAHIGYENGILTAKFNNDMKPHLLQLKSFYTKFQLKEFKPFDSKYSIRIYQLLKQYQHFGERTFELENLRKILGLQAKELKNFVNFRRRVLEVAQRELENTPMAFDFIPIKKGKGGKVVEVKFILKNKQAMLEDTQVMQEELPIQKEQPPQPQEMSYSESLKDQITKLLDMLPQEKRTYAIEKAFINYLQKCDIDYIKKQIEYVNTQKPNNYFAYLKKAIEEDYANAQMAELEKTRQQQMLEKALQDLEAERQHNIEVDVDIEKSVIYSDYLKSLDDKEKEEFLKKYLEKAKKLYPDINEKSYEMEFKVECLAVEDIIAKNEIYQKRLNRVRERAEKQAQAEYERSKESLYMKLQNN